MINLPVFAGQLAAALLSPKDARVQPGAPRADENVPLAIWRVPRRAAGVERRGQVVLEVRLRRDRAKQMAPASGAEPPRDAGAALERRQRVRAPRDLKRAGGQHGEAREHRALALAAHRAVACGKADAIASKCKSIDTETENRGLVCFFQYQPEWLVQTNH